MRVVLVDGPFSRVFNALNSRALRSELLPRIRLILTTLDASNVIEGMNNPLFRLHPLKGNRRGHWAVTVRANWRITFRFAGGEARDVDFTDYH